MFTPSAARCSKLFLTIALAATACGCASRTHFSSSDQAVDSLVTALRANDQPRLNKILGPHSDELLSSGDQVADHNAVQQFLTAYDEGHHFEPAQDGAQTLVVGNSNWPMPIPLVPNKSHSSWTFDVAAGKDEMLNRRIGRNELDVAQVCLAIVDAEREYASADPEHVGTPVYADQFLSDPNRKNGLYWPTAEGETPSPLGDAIARASDQGYTFVAGHPAPYHGYYYRILKAQGNAATGGAQNYIINGKMTGGFAILAFPASYGNSGIETFIVNQTGIVYSCDLGPTTQQIASAQTAFNPDENWQAVKGASDIVP